MIQPPTWISMESWEAFHDMRRKIKAPLTAYAERLVIVELAKLKANRSDPQACLDQSIMNGWRDVFPPRDKGLSKLSVPSADETLNAMASGPPADPAKARAALALARASIKRVA